MRLLRPPDLRVLQKWTALSGAALALVVVPYQAAASGVGVQLGQTGLPSSWIGEALMVSLAFALPAIVAGLTIALRRLLRKSGPSDAFRPRL